jgi:hypothetical protein
MREVFGIDSQIMPHPVTGRPLCIPLRKLPLGAGPRAGESTGKEEPVDETPVPA